MPLEIRELVIKAVLADQSEGTSGGKGLSANNDAASDQNIIKKCVDQVIEILSKKDER